VGYAEFKEDLVKTITSYGASRMVHELDDFLYTKKRVLTSFHVNLDRINTTQDKHPILVANHLITLLNEINHNEKFKEFFRNQTDLWPICVRLEQIG